MGLIALGGLAALVGFLVTGCSKDKKEVETHKEEDIIETLKEQEMEDSKKLVVAGAKVLCTSCESVVDNVLMEKEKGGEVTNGALELNHKDIVFAPLFPTCKHTDDLKCTPDIEKEEWQDYDEMHKTGDENYGLIKETSYMFCLNGAGIIYISEDGQMEKGMEELWAGLIFEKWWNGTDVGNDRINRLQIENALDILQKSGNLPNITPYITKEKMIEFGFNEKPIDLYYIADLNRVLEKYNINSEERICQFLGQCYIETGSCENLPIENDYGQKGYLESLFYYPYIGTGHIQMTHDYAYMAFATFKILEAFPELKENVSYVNPRNNPKINPDNPNKGVEPNYNLLKEEAKKKNIDISEYTQIYEGGNDIAKYVASEYGWECAGYWWEAGGCNDIVDKFVDVEDENQLRKNVDEITNKVNRRDREKDRQDSYLNIKSKY